nr:MAG TPA: hypothetical protein [Caudoviricetes sp.]
MNWGGEARAQPQRSTTGKKAQEKSRIQTTLCKGGTA